MVCVFLKSQLIDYLRDIGIAGGFNLKPDIFVLNFNEEIDIVSTVPFVRSRLYFNTEFIQFLL